MKKSFWGLLWSSFLEIQTFWFGFLGVVLAILFSVVTGKVSIPLYIVIIIVTILLLITSSLYRTLVVVYRDYKRLRHPAILRVEQDKKTGLTICLFENSDLFATDLRVSFYYIYEYELEVLIGVGYIRTVQSNGKVQAIIDYPDQAYQDILTQLSNRDKQVVEKVVIRPGIPRNFNQP